MNTRLLYSGLVLWAGGTLALRVAGQSFLHPGNPGGIALVFLISFPLMGWLGRRLCRRVQLPADQWLKGAVAIALPTLLLDPFSSAFFPQVFPNMAPEMAGVFGGWMLWCCAGALAGALIPVKERA